MLRELAEALEALTGEQPLVLVLEDLHWSDHATLDLLTWLARWREPARLLVLGTYRPVDVIIYGHPLFMVQAVDTWLQHGWVAESAGQWAIQVGLYAVATAVPESVRQLIEQQLDVLSAEGQRLLEAASVVGESFMVPAVAAGVELPAEQVEAQCAARAVSTGAEGGGLARWDGGGTLRVPACLASAGGV